MDTATLLKTETPALLVPRAGDDAAMKRIRESLPGLNPEFCYYDELEALLPLATFVAVRIRSRTLDVDLILEDPELLNEESLTPQYLQSVASIAIPGESEPRPQVRMNLKLIVNGADARAYIQRLRAFRVKTQAAEITATFFDAQSDEYWSNRNFLERYFEKRRMIAAARIRRDENLTPGPSIFDGAYNRVTSLVGALSGFALAMLFRLIAPEFDLPASLFLLSDTTAGMIAFGIAMFAGRPRATSALQGLLTTTSFVFALYPLLVYLGPLDWILGASFALNGLLLTVASFLLGRVLEQARVDEAVAGLMRAERRS